MNVKHCYKSSLLLLSLFPGMLFASHWGYEGENGPENWAKLDNDFHICQSGMNQSPINISQSLKANIPALKTDYHSDLATVTNNGHTIQAQFKTTAQNTIIVDGQPYTLQQFHFHSPSENTVQDKHYAMEMHLVHKNSQGEVVVVAVMFDKGATNRELAKLWQAMPGEHDKSLVTASDVDINALLPADKTYWRFSGSLTTPPCSEGVTWLVMKHPLTLSDDQLAQFTHVMHHANNRPTQPIHGRVVVE